MLQYGINHDIPHICGMCVSSMISFSTLSGQIMRKAQWHTVASLRWRHIGRHGVSNHQPHDCLLNRLLRHRSKRTSKLCVTGLCVGKSPGTGEFPAQMASNAENVSISWRHHVMTRKAFWITGPLWREFTSDRWRAEGQWRGDLYVFYDFNQRSCGTSSRVVRDFENTWISCDNQIRWPQNLKNMLKKVKSQC